MAQQTHAAEQLQKRESQRGRGDGDAEAGAAEGGHDRLGGEDRLRLGE